MLYLVVLQLTLLGFVRFIVCFVFWDVFWIAGALRQLQRCWRGQADAQPLVGEHIVPYLRGPGMPLSLFVLFLRRMHGFNIPDVSLISQGCAE